MIKGKRVRKELMEGVIKEKRKVLREVGKDEGLKFINLRMRKKYSKRGRIERE